MHRAAEITHAGGRFRWLDSIIWSGIGYLYLPDGPLNNAREILHAIFVDDNLAVGSQFDSDPVIKDPRRDQH